MKMYHLFKLRGAIKRQISERVIELSFYFFIIVLIITSCSSPLEPIIGSDKHLCYNKQDSRWQIYLNNINGNSPQNVSNNPSDDAYSPLWSLDGKHIAFRYDRENSGGCDIYLYGVENAKTINITSEFHFSESAIPILWSPDSKKLIYNYHKIGEPAYNHIMNSNGTQKQRLPIMGQIINFCDQGNSVLFTNDCFLYKMNLETNVIESIMNLRETSIYTTWIDDYDPISNTILCHEDSSSWGAGATFLIKKINLRTMETDTLVIAENEIKLLRPVFSNDYSRVAYIEWDYTNNISKLILLENGKKTELNRLTKENESYGWYKIEFSPYDSYITYTVLENIPGQWVAFNSYVYVLNIATKKTRLIDEGNDSHWNPLINL